jgi:hypothetical protein
MKISEKKISFFSTLNQYFPHIPYVASKNRTEPQDSNSNLKKTSKFLNSKYAGHQ